MTRYRKLLSWNLRSPVQASSQQETEDNASGCSSILPSLNSKINMYEVVFEFYIIILNHKFAV